eukprot:gene6996-7210_t
MAAASTAAAHVAYDYVDKEDDMPSEFICTKYTSQACTCPYCRRKLRYSELQYSLEVQQRLDALQVYCPNAAAGCQAVMARAKVAAHLRTACALQELAAGSWEPAPRRGAAAPEDDKAQGTRTSSPVLFPLDLRQQVTADDLRAALTTTGYSHMLPPRTQPEAAQGAAGGVLGSLLGL